MEENKLKLTLKNFRAGLSFLLNAKYFTGKAVIIGGIAVFFGAAFLFLTYHYVTSRAPSSAEKINNNDPDFQSGYGVGYDLGIRNIPINKNQMQGVSPVFKDGFLAGYIKGKQNYHQDRLTTASQKARNPKSGSSASNNASQTQQARLQKGQQSADDGEAVDFTPGNISQSQKSARPAPSGAMQTNRPKRGNAADRPATATAGSSTPEAPTPISIPNPITTLPKSKSTTTQSTPGSMGSKSESSSSSSSGKSASLPSQAPTITLPTIAPSSSNTSSTSNTADAYNTGYSDGYNDQGYNNKSTAQDDWKSSYQEGYFEGKNNRQDYFTAYDKGSADAQGKGYVTPPEQKGIYYNAGYNDGFNAIYEETSGAQAGAKDAKNRASKANLSNVSQAYAEAYQKAYNEALNK